MIVLTVLKWIGLCLLFLLLLILFLLLLLLFLPFRYELTAERDRELPEGGERRYLLELRVGWMQRLLSFVFHMDNAGSVYRLRLAFLTLLSDEERGGEPDAAETAERNAPEEL